MNVDHSVTPHRSCYIHGLWFCLFCGNTNSHRSLKLNGQGCSSSGLLFSPNVETTCACADTTSRLPHCRHGSLPCCCGGGLGSAVGCSQRGSPSVALPLPPRENSFSRTRRLEDNTGSSKTGSFHRRRLNAGTYNFCISKARTIEKL